MDTWRPATVEEVVRIVNQDLEVCDAKQVTTFKKYRIEPYVARIVRCGSDESVIVVARRGNEVIYWEDVEAGFNISPIGPNEQILEHGCNQNLLAFALNA